MSTPEDTFRRLRQTPIEQIIVAMDQMTEDEFKKLNFDSLFQSHFFDSHRWTYNEFAKSYREYMVYGTK